jgi:hypothetical protein
LKKHAGSLLLGDCIFPSALFANNCANGHINAPCCPLSPIGLEINYCMFEPKKDTCGERTSTGFKSESVTILVSGVRGYFESISKSLHFKLLKIFTLNEVINLKNFNRELID